MTKTVKELIENILYGPNDNEYYISNIDDLDEIKRAYEKELAAKEKEYGILLADRDKLEIYWHNRLKKSNVEVKVWCNSCECWVTDDIQDCYCKCTCNFGEDSDYDCIYEENINTENDCPRNKEWSWQYEISEKQYESLEE